MKTIATRKSTRVYTGKQISDEVLNAILAAGCAAPVGMGMYDSLHLTVIQDKEILKNISAGVAKAMNMDSDPLYGAPTIVLVSSKEPIAPGVDYTNAGAVIQNMLLAATDKGIGSVLIWGTALAVGAVDELRKALAIPDGFNPVCSAALGYATSPDQTEKDLSITISMNRV